MLTVCSAQAGVTESNEKQIKGQLKSLIDYFAKTLPDPARASEDLMKFAKMHDRRSYQLIRFCTSAESDYRKVYKAIVRQCCCTDLDIYCVRANLRCV